MRTDENEHRYDDIINLPHYQSVTRSHMSNYDRAAQFSPFAALTGYDDAVTETERLTDRKIELDEYGLDIMQCNLLITTMPLRFSIGVAFEKVKCLL